MAWPSTCRDLALVDALQAAILALPEWLALEPLDDAVYTLEWPATPTDGPRAMIAAPKATLDAEARQTCRLTSEVSIEFHVPVDAREAMAAFATLRDAIAFLSITGTRIMSVRLSEFERGKFVSSTAASSSSVSASEITTESTPDTPSPAWSRDSAVAHKGVIVVRLFQVPFTI